MDSQFRRDPERLLEEIEREERREKRGRLKVFLGYASGVGKSAKMLAEGLRRRERGEDVIIGAMQPKSSPESEPRKQFRWSFLNEQTTSKSSMRPRRRNSRGFARWRF